MRELPSFYILYCINVHCKDSIFHNSHKYFVPFQAESILSFFSCPTCQQTLVSAMDIELEQIMATAKVSLPGQD